MSLAGNRSSAVVVASGHQSYRINGLSSGEVVVYNQWGQFVRLGEDGIVVEASGQPVTVNSATTLKVTATDGVTLETPSLKVTGDITDNCETNSTTLKALREAYNIHTHPGQRCGERRQHGDKSGNHGDGVMMSAISRFCTMKRRCGATGPWAQVTLSAEMICRRPFSSACSRTRLADASDETDDGNRRGWWGDLEQDYRVGSRLWLLRRQKLTTQVALKAEAYAREALQWLKDDGVVASLDVEAWIVPPDGCT